MKTIIVALRSLIVAVVVAAGCSTVPHQVAPAFEPRPVSRTFVPLEPTPVAGRVLELKAQGAWIDFDDRFVSYRSVVVELSTPAEARGKLAYLQYQGDPVANGLQIQPGQIIALTMPVVPPSSCCEPYLKDIADIRVLPDGS